MLFVVGVCVVLGSVIGGYVWHNGKMGVLWQPSEFLIILGAALGSFLISNPLKVVKRACGALKFLFKGSPFNKKSYIELLCLLFTVFKMIKSKGMLEIEQHLDKPHESAIFSQFPEFVHNHHGLEFFCDYMRILTMGVDNYMQIEELMLEDLETHHHENEQAAGALVNLADAMPALGIVAAVLGVITTMGSITEPPEVLGHLIGAALVGTFLGVLVSYGFVSPIGRFVGGYLDEESKYLNCIKVAMLSHLKGNAPTVSVEFARRTLRSYERPSFAEVETALGNLGSST